MTIYLYSGRPGSGKSLHAAKDVMYDLKNDRKPVITNFEVRHDESWKGHSTYVPNCDLSAEYLCDFASDTWRVRDFAEDGILLVVDEAQLLWNSRNWQDNNRMEFLQFMSQHRKFGYKIILIAQSDIMIDKQFRTLIEYEVFHRKASNYGAFGRLIKLLCFGEMFIASTYYYEQKNVKLDTQWYRYDKKAAAIYDSYKTFDQKMAQLSHVQDEKPVFHNPYLGQESGTPAGVPLPGSMV